MLRKLIIIIVITLVLVPAFMPGPAAAQVDLSNNVWIFADYTAYFEAGTSVDAALGWAVCRAPGLLEAHRSSARYELWLDGQQVLDPADTLDYWQDDVWVFADFPGCNNHPDDYIINFWEFPLGVLSPGTHVLETRLTLKHTVTDMWGFAPGVWANGDWKALDGGAPDIYRPLVEEHTIIIEIVS